MRRGNIGDLIQNTRLNAVISWTLVAFLALVVVESIVGFDLSWAVFAGAVTLIALIPTLRYRNVWAMLPWEVLVLAALPIVGRALGTRILTTTVATYVSVAAVALIIAVELHVFTPVRMPDWFAVVFVVISTLATAGVWAVVQWISDIYLGTGFLGTEEELMWSFVAATAAGVLAGAVFALYFRRVAVGVRLPDEVGGGLSEDT